MWEKLRGSHVFITGGTGFLGKMVIESLLRHFHPERIYLLIRPSKKLSPQDRLAKDVIESRCFDRLRAEHANFEDLVSNVFTLISGDLTVPKLGISDSDAELLCNKVQFVIHCGASTDFNNPLDQQVQVLLRGTLSLFDLATRMTHLQTFVHVSTAYVNANRPGAVEERIYDDVINDPVAFAESLLLMPNQQLLALQNDMLRMTGHPNTYTFVKSLTEPALVAKRGNIPLAIVRPSICGSAVMDPMPGWIDSLSGASIGILAVGVGSLRSTCGNGKMICDFVPMDYAANACVAAAVKCAGHNAVHIFNVTTSFRNPLTWEDALRHVRDFWRAYPAPRSFNSHPKLVWERFVAVWRAKLLIKYKIPNEIIKLVRKYAPETQTIKMLALKYRKTVEHHTLIDGAFRFFTTSMWKFEDHNTRKLYEEAKTWDPSIRLEFDVANIDWAHYMADWTYGISKLYLKNNDMTYEPKAWHKQAPPGHQLVARL